MRTYLDCIPCFYRQAGLDQAATIISSGSDAPGTFPDSCPPEFQRMLQEASFVGAKGQGNYESLSAETKSMFFLLKAKCEIIAADVGVAKGDLVLKGITL